MVRRPSKALRYDPTFTFQTVKRLGRAIAWGTFSRNLGRAGLYIFSKNETMKGNKYINVLKECYDSFMLNV